MSAKFFTEGTTDNPARPTPHKVVDVKQYVYTTILLITMLGAIITIWLAVSQNDHLWIMHLTLQTVGVLLCGYFLVKVQNIANVEPCEKYMAASCLGYTYAWDILNIIFARFPDDTVARQNSVHMIGIALLVMGLRHRNMIPAAVSLFSLHTGLTWANLGLFGWQGDYGARIASDLTSLVLVLVISLLATYANTLTDVQNRNEAIETIALTDHLTQLPNRRALQMMLEEHPDVSVALIDIDNFKRVNDTYGHNHGDTVLIDVAHHLASAAQHIGHVGRWGGEEFLIVMPEASRAQTLVTCERARQYVQDRTGNPVVTISIGLATRRPDETADQLLHRCDELMYDAKRSSKNCVRTDTSRPIADLTQSASSASPTTKSEQPQNDVNLRA